MDDSSRSPEHSGPVSRSLQPFRSVCPEDCATLGARTITGRRCSLLGCMETIPGYHYSHSNFCLSNSNLQVSPSAHGGVAPVLVAPSCSLPVHAAANTMPRLRQRMTCRRGATRGRSASDRPSISFGGDPFTEQTERRLAQDHSVPPGHTHGNHPSAPPLAAPPSPSFSVPHHSGNHILRQTSQRAKLRFDSAFNRPTITAYITITLREESTFYSPPVSEPTPSPLDPIPNPAAIPTVGPSDPLVTASPSLEHLHMQVEANLSGRDGAQSADEDPEEQYGCRIEEEPPAPTHMH